MIAPHDAVLGHIVSPSHDAIGNPIKIDDRIIRRDKIEANLKPGARRPRHIGNVRWVRHDGFECMVTPLRQGGLALIADQLLCEA